MTVYQVWTIPDDLEYAMIQGQDIFDKLLAETQDLCVAMWVADTCPISFAENSILMVRELTFFNGKECAIKVIEKFKRKDLEKIRNKK